MSAGSRAKCRHSGHAEKGLVTIMYCISIIRYSRSANHIAVFSYHCSVPYAYLYHTRMVHTIHVYAYGITIRVWYGLLYHMRMVHIRHHWCI